MPNINIAKRSDRSSVYTIVVDEEGWRDIHTSIFGKRIQLPNCSSVADLEQWFETTEYKATLQYTLKRLSLKSYSSTELKKLLIRRLVTDSTAGKVISECVKLGYINDHEWIKSFIRQQKTRKLGPNLIRIKLLNKGVDQDTINQYLSSANDTEEQAASIQQLLKTRHKNKDLSDYATRQKVIASLLRKGFELDVVLNLTSDFH